MGGTGVVARICSVTSQAVSKWKREGAPKDRLDFLRLIEAYMMVKYDLSAIVPDLITKDERLMSIINHKD